MFHQIQDNRRILVNLRYVTKKNLKHKKLCYCLHVNPETLIPKANLFSNILRYKCHFLFLLAFFFIFFKFSLFSWGPQTHTHKNSLQEEAEQIPLSLLNLVEAANKTLNYPSSSLINKQLVLIQIFSKSLSLFFSLLSQND